MPTTDPIADMLTRIRNGLMVRKSFVLVPSSKIKVAIAQILLEEGFIQGYEVTKERPQPNLRVWLKYDKERKPDRDRPEAESASLVGGCTRASRICPGS